MNAVLKPAGLPKPMLPTHPRIPKEHQTNASDLRPSHLTTLNTVCEVVVSALRNPMSASRSSNL